MPSLSLRAGKSVMRKYIVTAKAINEKMKLKFLISFKLSWTIKINKYTFINFHLR